MKTVSRFLTLLLLIGVVFTLSACKKDKPNPEVVTEYNALGEWTDGGDGVYIIDTNTEEDLDFSYDKAAFTYAYMMKNVSEDLSDFKKLVVTAEGTGTILLKLETDSGEAKEISLNVTGISGSYEWNLINDSEFLAEVTKMVIIAAPGKENSVGDINITEMMFSVNVAENYIIQSGFNNIPQNVNEYDGSGDTFDFNDKWANFSEESYTFTYENDVTSVSFDKGAGLEWSAIKSAVQGDFTEFNYIVLVVSGTDGQKLLAKPSEFGAYENYVFLSSEQQELVLDISEMPTSDKNAITDILLFGAAGIAPATGEITIHEAFFAKEYTYEAPVIDKNVYASGDTFSLNHWYDGGDNNYTISENNGDTIIDYNKTGAWTYAIAHIEGDLSVFTKVTLEVTGVENKTALFKIESATGAKEEIVTFDGTKQTITIDLSTMTEEQRSSINKFLVFAAQGSDIGSGSITVHNVTFVKPGYNFNDLWAEADADTYDITYDGTKTTVVYNKVVGQEWSYMVADFASVDVSEYNTLTLVIDGTSGKQVLIKPNDDGALEQWVTFGDTPVTVEVTAASFSKIVIFAEAGTAPATDTFEILEATLSSVVSDVDLTTVVDFTEGAFVENDAGTYSYTVVEGTTVVDYTKAAGQEWVLGKIEFDQAEVAGLNTMTLVLQGTLGKQLLLKPNDDGALENWVTFTEEPVTVVVTAEQFNNLIFFAEAGVADVSGQFTILSAKLSYSASFSNWVDNGDGAHTITDNEGVLTVAYDKAEGQDWTNIKINFDQAEVVGLNTLTLVIDGTSGKQVLIKPNDDGALEQWVTFGDTPVTVEVTAASFSSVIIFAEGGTALATDSFEILETSLSYSDIN